ncbi:hypothetical protein [Micropruina sp.]|uniref:hypothetical protein n=1 Tax=Micropruina sp. TaxID=2737536 RepID=UPI0039E3F67F
MADPLEDKYTQLVAQGWSAAPPEPYQGLPVGGGRGVWFGWTTASGVPVAIYRSVVTGPVPRDAGIAVVASDPDPGVR